MADTGHDIARFTGKAPLVGKHFERVIDATVNPLDYFNESVERLRNTDVYDTYIRPESAFDSTEDRILNELLVQCDKWAQALILRQVMAFQYLSSQMTRPVCELKEEGFFEHTEAECFGQGCVGASQ